MLAERPGSTIVADVKSSDALFDTIARYGGTAVMWQTGHSRMKAKLKELGAPLAGELSGHIFFAHDYYGFDDALYAAVRVIGALDRSGGTLADWVEAQPPRCTSPEMRVPVAEARKTAIVAEVLERLSRGPARIDTTDGMRVSTDDGWWLLRASNTQAALTLRAMFDGLAKPRPILPSMARGPKPPGMTMPSRSRRRLSTRSPSTSPASMYSISTLAPLAKPP